MRIKRCWLFENGYSESDHFITTNAYTCIEINAHLMLSILYNVINGKFPKDVLRVWLTGSQGREQPFRLLRSMTPVFSTIINFSLKGVLERIHKLNYISSIECTEEIIFPIVQRRLLQLNNETDETFLIPTLVEVKNEIRESKKRAILLSQKCRMELNSYDDDCLVKDTTHLVEDAIHHDQEDEDTNIRDGDEEQPVAESDIAQIREDIAVIQLQKKSNTSLPTYIQSAEKGSIHSHSNSTVVDSRKSKKTPFVEYNGAYIRKTTALYLLQENYQVSNDRLLRVRSSQPSHLFSASDLENNSSSFVRMGDLCLFHRVDSEKVFFFYFFMHFCPGTMTTHAETINSDLQRGLDRCLRHIQH